MRIQPKVKKRVIVTPTVPVVKRKTHAPAASAPARPAPLVVQTYPTPAAVRQAFKAGKQGRLIETEKQRKLAHLISVNIGKPKPLTMTEMMRLAGYAESTALAQTPSIVDAARGSDEVQTHLSRLQKLRDKTMTRIEVETDQANYGQLAFGLQVLEKSIALLEGRPTERTEHTLGEEERSALDEIIAMNE